MTWTCLGASAPLLVVVTMGICASAVSSSDSNLDSRFHVSAMLRHSSLQPASEPPSLVEAEGGRHEAGFAPKIQATGASWWPESLLASGAAVGRRRRKAMGAPAAAAPSPNAAPSTAPAPAPAPAQAVAKLEAKESKDEEITEVMHYKDPGEGYKKGSPLYNKQAKLQARTRVSMTMKCIICLIVQFFIVHTALFITESVNQISRARSATGEKALPRLAECLQNVKNTIYFVPMLCVLFLATRMRAIQLAQGMTERHDLPQWWVQTAMLVCTGAVCWQTILAAVYYALMSKVPSKLPGDKDSQAVKGGNLTPIEKALNAARWLAIAFLYVGFMVVCIGICIMPAPQEIWGKGGGPRVSPAVVCTIALASLYFGVHFCIGLMETLDELLTPQGQRFGVMAPHAFFFRDAALTVDISPMLCILFLAARLRALQLDPKTGNPQAWAQTFFYVASTAVLALVLLSVLVAAVLPKEAAQRFFAAPQEQGGVATPPTPRVKAAEAVRFLFAKVLYLSAAAVIFSICTQSLTKGPTPAIPPSIKCVIILMTVYLLVCTGRSITTTVRKVRSSQSSTITKLDKYLDGPALHLYPMVSVLFLGTFMRALQITAGRGAPQSWAQTFMYVGTMALVLMTLGRVDSFFSRLKPEDDATSGAKPPNTKLIAFFVALQHLCLLLVHVTVVAVIIALFVMTPATAKGTGAIVNLSGAANVI